MSSEKYIGHRYTACYSNLNLNGFVLLMWFFSWRICMHELSLNFVMNVNFTPNFFSSVSLDICQYGPLNLWPRRHQARSSSVHLWGRAQKSGRKAQSEGGHQCVDLWGPGDSQVSVSKVRGEDGAPSGVHHRSGSLSCGSDGLRTEESCVQGMDPGGRCPGVGWQRNVSHWRVWQGDHFVHCYNCYVFITLTRK